MTRNNRHLAPSPRDAHNQSKNAKFASINIRSATCDAYRQFRLLEDIKEARENQSLRARAKEKILRKIKKMQHPKARATRDLTCNNANRTMRAVDLTDPKEFNNEQ